MIGLSSLRYLKNVYLNVIGVTVVSIIVPLLLSNQLNESFFSFVILSVVAMASTVATELLIGCDKNERAFVFEKVKSLKTKIIKS